jgi:1,6-anhydro-N-acetylmuramate kinase
VGERRKNDSAAAAGTCSAILILLPAPKSTGREYFNYGWLERQLARFPALAPRMSRRRWQS